MTEGTGFIINAFEVPNAKQVLKVADGLTSLRMTHKVDLSVLAPASWEPARVTENVFSILYTLQVLRFIVSVKVMFFYVTSTVYLLSD